MKLFFAPLCFFLARGFLKKIYFGNQSRIFIKQRPLFSPREELRKKFLSSKVFRWNIRKLWQEVGGEKKNRGKNQRGLKSWSPPRLAFGVFFFWGVFFNGKALGFLLEEKKKPKERGFFLFWGFLFPGWLNAKKIARREVNFWFFSKRKKNANRNFEKKKAPAPFFCGSLWKKKINEKKIGQNVGKKKILPKLRELETK